MNATSPAKRGPLARAFRWARELRALPPGKRFVTLHDRHTHGPRHLLGRILGVTAGIGLIIFGIIELVIPGPGILVILLGGALLAREFHSVACWMDSAELKCRAAGHACANAWRGASNLARAAVVTLAAAGLGATAWLVVMLVLPRR